MKIGAVIPALDEEATIGPVVAEVARQGVAEVIVVDNGSRDRTAKRARAAGARVVVEKLRGYGAACRAGIAALNADIGIVVILAGDGADDPTCVPLLVDPIVRGEADLVVGARPAARREPGAMVPAQRFGNWLAGKLLGLLFQARVTDLGSMRAVSSTALRRLELRDRGSGFTAEMRARAALLGLRTAEVEVPSRRRAGGRQKVSGTVRGSLRAGGKILWTLAAIRLGR